jgi:drug/metabolite transporter superfamily protein YnfA
MVKSFTLFILAGLLEIGGGYLVRLYFREYKPLYLAGLGILAWLRKLFSKFKLLLSGMFQGAIQNGSDMTVRGTIKYQSAFFAWFNQINRT